MIAEFASTFCGRHVGTVYMHEPICQLPTHDFIDTD